MIIASTFIEGKKYKNCLVTTSSHNTAAEKQYRNPTEYGTPKPDTTTFTVTGGAAILLTSEKTNIKVTSSTIGKIIDKNIKDVNHMGAVMAPAAADTIYRHLTSLKQTPDYYDMILTGDLGYYGKEILLDYMKKAYNLDISKQYNDCGVMIYDRKTQPVFAGGSGPACSALVNFSYIYQLLKEKSKELDINFVGNVEGRDAFSGKIDAIISDGFTGNVFLKTTEGLGKFVKKSLKESMMKNILSKIASIPSLPAINRFAKTMDYKAYGGALFLGVKKPVVKAHGSSDEILFEYTIIQAEKFVENKAVDKMIEQFTKNNEDSNKNVND